MDRIEQVMRGMTLEFFGNGRHKIAMPDLIDQGGVLLDVRSDEEARLAPFPFTGLVDTLHIPLEQLPDRWAETPADRPLATFCSGGVRAAFACLYLLAQGRENARILEGGGYEALVGAIKPGFVWKRLRASS